MVSFDSLEMLLIVRDGGSEDGIVVIVFAWQSRWRGEVRDFRSVADY